MDKERINQLYKTIHLDEEKDKEEIEENLKENIVALYLIMDRFDETLSYRMKERVKEVKQYILDLEEKLKSGENK